MLCSDHLSSQWWQVAGPLPRSTDVAVALLPMCLCQWVVLCSAHVSVNECWCSMWQ